MKNPGVFIITGATGGLGHAISEAAYKAGYPLALIARSQKNLRSLKRDLEKRFPSKGRISIHAVDLTDEKKVDREFKAIGSIHGGLRALVNNAATWMGTTTVERISAQCIRESMELNFFSSFHATQAAIHVRGKRVKTPFSIVNIGATASLDSWMEVLPFCMAKGALRGYSRALARSLGPKGIHVAHLVIDGLLDNVRTRKLNPALSRNRFIQQGAVADTVLHIALQDRSAWTAEWDIRPFNETF